MNKRCPAAKNRRRGMYLNWLRRNVVSELVKTPHSEFRRVLPVVVGMVTM